MILHVNQERVGRLDLDKISENCVFLVERAHSDSWVDFLERFENFVDS